MAKKQGALWGGYGTEKGSPTPPVSVFVFVGLFCSQVLTLSYDC